MIEIKNKSRFKDDARDKKPFLIGLKNWNYSTIKGMITSRLIHP